MDIKHLTFYFLCILDTRPKFPLAATSLRRRAPFKIHVRWSAAAFNSRFDVTTRATIYEEPEDANNIRPTQQHPVPFTNQVQQPNDLIVYKSSVFIFKSKDS